VIKVEKSTAEMTRLQPQQKTLVIKPLIGRNQVCCVSKMPLQFLNNTVKNKCIGYDTKATTRQSLNCIKNKKK